MFAANFQDLVNIEKRKYWCDWIIRNCDYDISWIKIKDPVAAGINNLFKNHKHDHVYRSTPECKFYKLKPGYVAHPEAEVYTGDNFDPLWNTRDILLSEGIFEFERGKTWEENKKAFLEGLRALIKNKIHFCVFFGQGMRVPHIHIYDLFEGAKDFAERELAYYLFCRKVFPLEIRHFLDLGLAGQQTIALEFSKHWRSGHIKKLVFEFIPTSWGGYVNAA